jgi:hypothetical protein
MKTPLTPEELAELGRLYEAATKGEWWLLDTGDGDYQVVIGEQDDRICELHFEECLPNQNGAFIAAAHNALPRLLAQLAEVEGKLQRLELLARQKDVSDSWIAWAFREEFER